MGFSSYGEEQEVLFGLGTTFKLDQIEERTDDSGTNTYLNIKMHGTDEGKKIAQDYIKYRQQEMAGGNETILFGQLLNQMGEHRKAINYFENLLLSFCNDETNDLANVYYYTGDAYILEGDYKLALRCLQRSHEIYKKLGNKQGMANSQAREASVYVYQKNYGLAKHWLKRAVELYKQLPNQQLNLAFCKNGFGDIYLGRRKYTNALACYLNALTIRKEHLPDDHPEIAMSYFNCGRVYFLQGDHENAILNLEKALKRKQKIFPHNHVSIARNLHVMAHVYDSQGETVKAVELLQKALDYYNQTLIAYHPHIINAQSDICRIKARLAQTPGVSHASRVPPSLAILVQSMIPFTFILSKLLLKHKFYPALMNIVQEQLQVKYIEEMKQQINHRSLGIKGFPVIYLQTIESLFQFLSITLSFGFHLIPNFSTSDNLHRFWLLFSNSFKYFFNRVDSSHTSSNRRHEQQDDDEHVIEPVTGLFW
ncbi:unnamed protein product [Didymodactylos carnosus]|uniref:Uncharacterized protein n=1 Tax=Didymodactylos carnosus TaxID=1234261 RepID=A0A814ASQ3_9BILA|nr:unnamed protein product [Didymodactylos carnosus]CAF3696435.1 unnamed protein product [Didymodactylos carnosus]